MFIPYAKCYLIFLSILKLSVENLKSLSTETRCLVSEMRRSAMSRAPSVTVYLSSESGLICVAIENVSIFIRRFVNKRIAPLTAKSNFGEYRILTNSMTRLTQCNGSCVKYNLLLLRTAIDVGESHSPILLDGSLDNPLARENADEGV